VTRRGLLVLALLSIAAPAVAQGRLRQGGAGGRREAREELFKMVDAYIVSNLQESLGLTDEQFVKVLPLVKRLQTRRRENVQKRIETLAEMRRLLESGTATEPRVAELLKQLKAQEFDDPAAIRRDVEAIDAVLSPVQQAKFRLLEARVEQRIRELMSRARAQGGGRMRRERDGALDSDTP